MKRIAFFLFLVIPTILSACAASPPSSASEELIMYRWVTEDSSGEEDISLYFDTLMHLQCRTTGTELHTDYELDDSKIIIIDSLCGSVELDYSIDGSSMTLSYGEFSVTLDKA